MSSNSILSIVVMTTIQLQQVGRWREACIIRGEDLGKEAGMAAYLIVDIGPIHDEKAYAAYRASVSSTIARAGGEYLVRGGGVQVLEGNWLPQRVVVVRFDSADAARRWWSSGEYAELKSLRQGSAATRMILVDGVSNGGAS